MKMLQQLSRGLYHTLSATQLTNKDQFEDWDYINLGIICMGVKNDEGYSKVFLELGSDPGDSDKDLANKHGYEIVRLTHKYYFSNQSNHHHSEREYWEWTGNIYDYVKEIKKRSK